MTYWVLGLAAIIVFIVVLLCWDFDTPDDYDDSENQVGGGQGE